MNSLSPHLLPDRRHRALGRLLREARLRRGAADADRRRGDQRLHGPARRRAAVLELTYNHGVGDYDHGTGYGHIALRVERPRPDPRRPRRGGHRAREAALPPRRPHHRLPDLLRPRPRRLPDRADRESRRRLLRLRRGYSGVMPPPLGAIVVGASSSGASSASSPSSSASSPSSSSDSDSSDSYSSSPS